MYGELIAGSIISDIGKDCALNGKRVRIIVIPGVENGK